MKQRTTIFYKSNLENFFSKEKSGNLHLPIRKDIPWRTYNDHSLESLLGSPILWHLDWTRASIIHTDKKKIKKSIQMIIEWVPSHDFRCTHISEKVKKNVNWHSQNTFRNTEQWIRWWTIHSHSNSNTVVMRHRKSDGWMATCSWWPKQKRHQNED